jgi:hypothetical protein
MCQAANKERCEHPEKLKGKPEDCSTEQVKECHGEVPKHPCLPEKRYRKGASIARRKA